MPPIEKKIFSYLAVVRFSIFFSAAALMSSGSALRSFRRAFGRPGCTRRRLSPLPTGSVMASQVSCIVPLKPQTRFSARSSSALCSCLALSSDFSFSCLTPSASRMSTASGPHHQLVQTW
eukprot:COSAG04_NODE_2150_length_4685_cov_7.818975_3_plen_120_part_00